MHTENEMASNVLVSVKYECLFSLMNDLTYLMHVDRLKIIDDCYLMCVCEFFLNPRQLFKAFKLSNIVKFCEQNCHA